MRIGSVMTSKVLKIRMSDTIGTIREILQHVEFHHLLVVDGEKLVGIISDRDILTAIGPFLETPAERTRDIAILKTSGASSAFIVRQIVAESFLLTVAGTALGIVMSLLADTLIESLFPLLTVQIGLGWVLTGLAVAAAGALASAAYPAWRATRVDMVEALSWE